MKKLNVPFKFETVDQGCLLACAEMVLRFYKKPILAKNLAKKLSLRKFGYDILEIADWFIQNGYKIEIGGFDPDIFKTRKANFTLEDLKNIDPKKLTKYPRQDLRELIKFAKKYPNQLGVGYKKLDFLKQQLDKNLPIIVNLEIKTYTGDKTDNSIHSVIVAGYDKNDILVMDPILEKIRIGSKKFAKAWFNAGQYYLVIKKMRSSFR